MVDVKGIEVLNGERNVIDEPDKQIEVPWKDKLLKLNTLKNNLTKEENMDEEGIEE